LGPAPTLEWSLNKRQVEEDLHEDFERRQTATVARLHGEGPVKRRIMDMGITKGVEIYVRKVAPLGDPMELTVRNYELSVRKADAEMIEVV
jgi:ferrous iron transport protein A